MKTQQTSHLISVIISIFSTLHTTKIVRETLPLTNDHKSHVIHASSCSSSSKWLEDQSSQINLIVQNGIDRFSNLGDKCTTTVRKNASFFNFRNNYDVSTNKLIATDLIFSKFNGPCANGKMTNRESKESYSRSRIP